MRWLKAAKTKLADVNETLESSKQVERSSDYRCVLERAISRNCTCTSLGTTLARPATLCCVLCYDISCFSMYLYWILLKNSVI